MAELSTAYLTARSRFLRALEYHENAIKVDSEHVQSQSEQNMVRWLGSLIACSHTGSPDTWSWLSTIIEQAKRNEI